MTVTNRRKLVSASLTSITNFIFNRNLVSVYLHTEFRFCDTHSVEVMKRLMNVFIEVCLSIILVLFKKKLFNLLSYFGNAIQSSVQQLSQNLV